MDAHEKQRLYRLMHRLNAERRAVTDHLQSRSRQLDVTLRLLQRQLSAIDLAPTEVSVFDSIEPLPGGTNLRTSSDEGSLAYGDLEKKTISKSTDSKPWWPSIDDEKPPLKPSPGWQNVKLLEKTVRTVGILMLGQNADVIDRVVATFLRQQTQRQDFSPVFIIDSTYTDPFLHHGFVLEMIPTPEDQGLYSGSRAWHDYVLDRLITIRDKWYVTQFLEFGITRYSVHGIAEEQVAEPETASERFPVVGN